MALAIGFRFYDIQHYPPGLFPDQAANGEDALLILQGDLRPFYPRGNGREALFFFLQAGLIKLFGIGVTPMFAASALVGVLTVAAVFLAVKPFFGRLAALLSALLLATNYWHVTISRTGFRAVMIPLFVAAFTACVGYTIESVRRGRIWASYVLAVLGGLAFALGFYTYIAYRMMVGVVLAVLIILLIAALHPKIGFPHMRRYGWQILLSLLVAGLMIAPLAGYFVQHPEAFVGRAGQVSIFSPDLQRHYGGGTLIGTLAYSVRETLLSFVAGHGDLNWRHSVAGFPLLNPLVSFLFLLGLVWAFIGVWGLGVAMVRGREIHFNMIHAYLWLVFLGMLVPVVTTAEGMPHGLRSIGLAAPIFMLAGTAGAVVIRWLLKYMHANPGRGMVLGLGAGLLIAGSLYDGALYFLIARNDSQAYYEYRGDLTVVSEYINQYRAGHPDRPRPYLVLDEFSVQTVHYLASVVPHDYQSHPDESLHKYTLLDPATSALTALGADDVIIFTQSTIPDAERYNKKYIDQLELVTSQHNRFGQEIMRVYRLKPGALPDEADLDA